MDNVIESQAQGNIPLNDPEGNPVFASPQEAALLLQQGYSQVTPEQLEYLKKAEKYTTPEQMAKAMAEAAGSAASFGTSTLGEVKSGLATPEDIQGRREFLPTLPRIGSEIGGLAASSISGIGEGAALTKAGGLSRELLGLGGVGAGRISRLAAHGVGFGTEAAGMQLGDELSKSFSEDPGSGLQSAIANIGLAGAIGSVAGVGLGGVSELWNATSASRLGKILAAIKDKSLGKNVTDPAGSIDNAAERAGIELDPIVKAGIGSDPELRRSFQLLQEGTSSSAKKAQGLLSEFNKNNENIIAETVEKTPEEIEALSNKSNYDYGSDVKDSLKQRIDSANGPLSEKFEAVKEKYKDTPISDAEREDLATKLYNLSKEKDLGLLKGDPEFKLVNTAIESLSNVKTLENLRNFQTDVAAEAQKMEAWDLQKSLRSIFRDAEDNITLKRLGIDAPDLIAQHLEARVQYKAMMSVLDDLDKQLHLGRWNGIKSFVKKLEEMEPETLLKRITPKERSNFLETLNEHFPDTAKLVKDQFVIQALKGSRKGLAPDQLINPKSFLGIISKWDPKLREYALRPEQLSRLTALQELINAVPKKMNTSGTAGTLMALLSKWPSGMGAMASLLTGHGAASGYLLGAMGKILSNEAPDAIKIATLHYLGSHQAINPAAFKASVDVGKHFFDGQALINKTIKAIFNPGMDVLPSKLIPTDKDIKKLDKRITELQKDQSQMISMGGHTGYYLPEHASHLSAVAMRAMNYLASIKPHEQGLGLLDSKKTASATETYKYENALGIAEQPLVVLDKIKRGMLTPEDMITFKTIYPELYPVVAARVMTSLIEAHSNGKKIPYSTRLSLSLFLGQSLDSTMTPQGILAAQSTLTGKSNQQEGVEAMKQQSKMPQNAFGKIAAQNQTPQQARVSDKNANVS